MDLLTHFVNKENEKENAEEKLKKKDDYIN
jgi:hypothetical protein